MLFQGSWTSRWIQAHTHTHTHTQCISIHIICIIHTCVCIHLCTPVKDLGQHSPILAFVTEPYMFSDSEGHYKSLCSQKKSPLSFYVAIYRALCVALDSHAKAVYSPFGGSFQPVCASCQRKHRLARRL